MKRKVLVTIIVLIAIILLAGCAAPQATVQNAPAKTSAPTVKTIVWKGQSYTPTAPTPFGPFAPDQAGQNAMLIQFTKWIEQATGGRLKIEWTDAGSLFPQAEADLAIGKGVADITFSAPLYYTGRLPVGDLESGLPMSWLTIQDQYEALDRYGMYQIIKDNYAQHNLYWIFCPVDGKIGIGTKFSPDNPAAFKGKKIRSVGIHGEYVKLLDANVLPIAFGEMYMAMQLGTVEGFTSGPAVLEEQKMKEVCKYFLYNPIITTSSCHYLINMDSFKALPADIQQTIDASAKYVAYNSVHKWTQQSQWVMTNSQQYGIKFVSWSDSDINSVTKLAIEKLWPEVANKSPTNAKLVDIVKRQLKDYGRLK